MKRYCQKCWVEKTGVERIKIVDKAGNIKNCYYCADCRKINI